MPSQASKNRSPGDATTDVFRIKRGALGPVPACELQIKPLTVFVGRQGTGKSLVSQVLYFFEELPFLANFVQATARQAKSPDAIVRAVLDQLRSHERAFATFASPRVTIEWAPGKARRGRQPALRNLRFSAYRVNRLVKPDQALQSFVESCLAPSMPVARQAVFFPTERLVISQLRSAIAEKVLSLPITYTLFSEWMELASQVVSDWRNGPPTPEAAYVSDRAAEALGGRVVRWGERWKWRYGPGRAEQFDLDMASSGQRANWSIFYVAQALFALRELRQVSATPTVFVEEPEIHLHPAAQVVVTEILAFLVKQGFRVVLTTHSLNVVYALNNAIQAFRLGEARIDGAPAPELRLNPADVAVYAFGDGKPRSLMDVATGFIDERALGEVAEDLTESLNVIGAHLPPVEG